MAISLEHNGFNHTFDVVPCIMYSPILDMLHSPLGPPHAYVGPTPAPTKYRKYNKFPSSFALKKHTYRCAIELLIIGPHRQKYFKIKGIFYIFWGLEWASHSLNKHVAGAFFFFGVFHAPFTFINFYYVIHVSFWGHYRFLMSEQPSFIENDDRVVFPVH